MLKTFTRETLRHRNYIIFQLVKKELKGYIWGNRGSLPYPEKYNKSIVQNLFKLNEARVPRKVP